MTSDAYPPFLTASRVDLFRHCGASAVQAQTQDESAAASAGTESHAVTLRPGCMPQVFRDWFGAEPRYEAALAWDPATGRALHLGDGIERGYGLPSPGWLAGTADACAVRGSVLSVADLKCGFGQCRGGLGPPEQAGQLLLLAWLLWQVTASRQAERRLALGGGIECSSLVTAMEQCLTHKRTIAQCRTEEVFVARDWTPTRVRLAWFMQPEGGVPVVEDCEVEPERLRDWAQRLARRTVSVQADVPRPRPGRWCALCPCFDACPAMGQALKRLSDLPGEVASDEDAAAAHTAIACAERAVARGKRALRTYIERQPLSGVPVGGGQALRLVTSSRRTIDARLALDSGIVPASAAELHMTRESIARAMPGQDADAVVDRLFDAGAVIRTVTSPAVRLVRALPASEG